MKITIDTKDLTCKAGSKTYGDLTKEKQQEVENTLRDFLLKNTDLTDYETDSMWMSYRYCIGRHTIASHMRAIDIWKHCKGRISKEDQLFNAFDMNREIEDKLRFGYTLPSFHFPITSLNRIYATAVDIVCQFFEDYNITSKEELCKYRDVNIILSDNERGYKTEVTTWEEYLRPQVHKIMKTQFGNDAMSEDYAWDYFCKWRDKKLTADDTVNTEFKKISKNMPDVNYCYLFDFEDLFIWNDLINLFDYEHHHKSLLTNGEEVEWFWTWTDKDEKREDGNFYKAFGYKKIRVPVNDWDGVSTVWIPDESIKENIY